VTTDAPENKPLEVVNMAWLNTVPEFALASVNTGRAVPPTYEVEI
jgi:hypothetical protein